MIPARVPSLSAFFQSLGGLAALLAPPVVLGGLLLAPPAAGEMLVVPLTEGTRAHLPAHLAQSSIRFIAPGPVAGSLVIRADLAVARKVLADTDVVLLKVPDAACGGAAR